MTKEASAWSQKKFDTTSQPEPSRLRVDTPCRLRAGSREPVATPAGDELDADRKSV